jgi:hypothetical protein
MLEMDKIREMFEEKLRVVEGQFEERVRRKEEELGRCLVGEREAIEKERLQLEEIAKEMEEQRGRERSVGSVESKMVETEHNEFQQLE